MRKTGINFANSDYINPYRKKEIKFWAKKWHIRIDQLISVLGVTGSSRVEFIKQYLNKVKLI